MMEFMGRAAKQGQDPREVALWLVIDDRRRDIGWTQQQLADAVRVSKGQMSDILNGKKPSSFTEMVLAVDALGMSMPAAWREAERRLKDSGGQVAGSGPVIVAGDEDAPFLN